MAQQIQIFFEIFYRPHAAFCRVLDEGRFLFALVVAFLAGALFFGLLSNLATVSDLDTAQIPQQHQKGIASPPDAYTGVPPELMPGARPRSGLGLLAQIAGGISTVGSLLILAGFYVPVAIATIALWDSLGGVATILRRDYLPGLTCHLLSYAAVLLPLTALRLLPVPVAVWPAIAGIGAIYFLFLSANALRAVTGTSVAHSAFTAVLAAGAGAVGLVLYFFIGPSSYYFTSPFLLYYAYRYFQGDIQLIGSGLSSRQSLRRQLEVSKLNPRDWDAHFQIGLIQEQRRQYAEAEASFRKAIEIAPDEADPYFHLAKIEREKGRHEEALNALRKAAALDDKHSGSEVWRDLGAVALLANHPEEAQPALAKYVERRPYDPEGLYWYGKVLKKLGQPAAAKQAWEQAIEAVNTAPSHQRGRIRKWASETKAELKAL